MTYLKGLYIWILLGLLIGGILAPLSYWEILPLEVSLFWGLLGVLVGIPLIGLSVIWLSLLLFYRSFETRSILRGFRYIIFSGAGIFLAGLFLLLGVYLLQAFGGWLESKWILFWPLIVSACIIFWIGVYFKIGRNNFETFQRWERFLRREDADCRSFRKYLVDEIFLQRQLCGESRIRWVRHILIYWGFVLLLIADIFLAFINDFLPVFGWSQFLQHDNGIRLTLDFLLDFFGLMVLAGTSIALIRAYYVRGKEGKIYNDTLTAAFLFVITISGYLLEGFRLAAEPYAPYMAFSFGGNFIATLLRGWNPPKSSLYSGLWFFHVILACGFIAYFPAKRLVHSCATPVGKLMQSQQLMLARKVSGVVSGLLQKEAE